MKKIIYTLTILLVINAGSFAQQPFTAGNIVVYRVGDGSALLDLNATRVFLDEYTPNGTLVQSVALPVANSGQNKILTVQGTDPGSGMINLSANGRYILVPGINAVPGSSATSTAAVLGIVDANATVNTSTAITDFTESLNIPWTVNSDDGNRLWVGGSQAVRYTTAGSSTSVLLSTLSGQARDLKIAGGQLYAATSVSPKVFTVGTGLPVSGTAAITALPGLPTNIQGPSQFAFADMDPVIPGVDVLYVTSTHTAANAVIGIRKFSLVAGVWVGNGSIGGTVANSYFVGLTLKVEGNDVVLFATRQGANNIAKGGELVKITDNSGYNATMTGSISVLASVPVPNTMAFRGVALVPQPIPFTPGNFVVYRVGDGASVLDNSTARVFLDEYTTDGLKVQSILMPTATSGNNNILTAKGNDATAGMLNISTDGKYLVVPGINQSPGTVSSSTAAVIGMVDFNSKVNTTTAITNFPEGLHTPYSSISDDGNRIWFGGAGSLRYTTTGNTNSILIAAENSQVRDIKIVNGQLYAATASSPKLFSVGTGLPVTGPQVMTALPGLPTNIQGPGQVVFADLEPTVPGVDVLYIASTHTAANVVIGIRKFSLVGSVWVGNGSVGGNVPNSYFTGLTLKENAGTITLFATRQGANSTARGGELVRIVDNTGYNGTMNATPVVIASVAAPNTMAFRGVAPAPAGCQPVKNIRIPDISATQANVTWNASAGTGYEYAVTTSLTLPASGTTINSTSVSVAGLSNATTYYFHIRNRCSNTSYSEWATVSFITGCKPPASPAISITATAAGLVNARWNTVFGAANYEYSVSTNSIPPAAGTTITDSTVSVTGLNSITQYYLHVRSHCGSGVYSAWSTKAFSTGCFMPALNVKIGVNGATATWGRVTNAVAYEFAVTAGPAKPLSGETTSDTSYVSGNMLAGSGHYLHVRSICANGIRSEWSAFHFNIPGVEVYPNPVKEILNVRFYGTPSQNGLVSIADATGRIIYRQKIVANALTVDTRNWAAGIYHLRYDDGAGSFTQRIVKQTGK